MLRRVGLRRTGNIRRGARLKPMSTKRVARRAEYTAFKLALFELDRHVCQWCFDWRCRPLDPHHTRTPRAAFLCDIETVITLGRPHHDMATAAYSAKTGRLVITGTRSEGWSKSLVFAASKFVVRATAGAKALSVGSDH